MARKKTSNSKSYLKTQISVRLRQIRLELFGEHGGPELARRLDLPARTWYNYETGVTVPAEVMLNFIDQTGLNPSWLLTGEGSVFRESMAHKGETTLSPLQWIRRGLEQLELESQSRDQSFKAFSAYLEAETEKDFVSLPILDMEEVVGYPDTRFAQREQFMALRRWVPSPEKCFCLTVKSGEMEPVIRPGSIVIVDQSRLNLDSNNGKVVVALDTKGSPIIRRLERAGEYWILRAEQPSRDYPIITYNQSEAEGRIIGEIIGVHCRLDP